MLGLSVQNGQILWARCVWERLFGQVNQLTVDPLHDPLRTWGPTSQLCRDTVGSIPGQESVPRRACTAPATALIRCRSRR
jgi:hypothetical protein